MYLLEVGQKIKFNGNPGKVTGFFGDTVYIKIKGQKEEVETTIKNIEILEISGAQKMAILEWSLKQEILEEIRSNLKSRIKEYSMLKRLLVKYPNFKFWIEFYRPKCLLPSLAYLIGDGAAELDLEYKKFTVDISNKQAPIILNTEKIGEDIISVKKKRSIIDFLK